MSSSSIENAFTSILGIMRSSAPAMARTQLLSQTTATRRNREISWILDKEYWMSRASAGGVMKPTWPDDRQHVDRAVAGLEPLVDMGDRPFHVGLVDATVDFVSDEAVGFRQDGQHGGLDRKAALSRIIIGCDAKETRQYTIYPRPIDHRRDRSGTYL